MAYNKTLPQDPNEPIDWSGFGGVEGMPDIYPDNFQDFPSAIPPSGWGLPDGTGNNATQSQFDELLSAAEGQVPPMPQPQPQAPLPEGRYEDGSTDWSRQYDLEHPAEAAQRAQQRADWDAMEWQPMGGESNMERNPRTGEIRMSPNPVDMAGNPIGQGETLEQLITQVSPPEAPGSAPAPEAPAPSAPQAPPMQDVGGADLGPQIDQTLQGQMDGFDPLDMESQLRDLLALTHGGANSERLFNRQQAARENLTRGQEAAMGDIRGLLASRGLISQPGAPQGAELDATTRAFEPLQRAYLDELRQSEFDESTRAEQSQLDAIEAATGWTRDEAAQRLSGAKTAQDRERMMSEIALETLDQNRQWNQFLAEHGLEREKLAEEIRRGNIDAIMPLLQQFIALMQTSAGGYI